MKGYKFVTDEVAHLVAEGSVRLAPAEEFRQSADKPGARGDANELASRALIKDGAETFRSDHPAYGTDQFVVIVKGEHVPFEMTAIGESTAVVLDSLLYCFSLEDSPELRERMLADFHAGAVFEIADVDEFARILSAHPSLSSRELRKGRVQYSEVAMAASIAELLPVDALKKDAQFSWQQEYRLIWAAEFLQKPIILEVPELAGLLKRLP